MDVSTTETALLRRLLIRATELGARLFRNQVGRYPLPDGRMVSSGLCRGSSDLIGYLPVTITPAMVGRTLAVFVAVEVKTPTGRTSPEQQLFLNAALSHGAIAGVARSLDDLNNLLKVHV